MAKKIKDDYQSVMAQHYRRQPHRDTVMELASMPNRLLVAQIIHTMGRQNPGLNVEVLSKDVAAERTRLYRLEEERSAPRPWRMILKRLAFWRR